MTACGSSPMRRISVAAVSIALAWLAISATATDSKAASEYDGFLHKAPSLYVYTDWPDNTQTMDVSGSWWSDYKQAYAKRVGIAGWPSDFVAKFESFMATGSWAVIIDENPDGTIISLFGTADPNAYCDFSAPTTAVPSSTFGCTSHAGYDYATAEYFTHNSYGGNGCTGFVPPYNFCSDNGMNVYSHPVVGHATEERRFWIRFVSGSLNFYSMNFDVQYPDGYAGEQIETKPVPQSPPTPASPPPPTCATSDLTCAPPTMCPRVKLIGVRGSGETSGLGKIVRGFSKRFEERLTSKFPGQVDLYYEVPVSYQATSIEKALAVDSSSGRLVATKYRLSVDSGIESLTSLLSNDPCSSMSQYVLVGYSQGAHVIGDVLAKRVAKDTLARIRAVVFFGDPKFNPKAKEVRELGGFSSVLDGVRGGRKSGALNALRNRVFSFCRKGDIVCQWRLSEYIANRSRGIKQHEKYGKSEFNAAVSKVTPLIK